MGMPVGGCRRVLTLLVAAQNDNVQLQPHESLLLVDDHHPLAQHVATAIREASPVVARPIRSTHQVVAHRKNLLVVVKSHHSLFSWRTMRATRFASDRWIDEVRVFRAYVTLVCSTDRASRCHENRWPRTPTNPSAKVAQMQLIRRAIARPSLVVRAHRDFMNGFPTRGEYIQHPERCPGRSS